MNSNFEIVMKKSESTFFWHYLKWFLEWSLSGLEELMKEFRVVLKYD